MMSKHRAPMTAAELAARLQEDPKFRARQQEKERALAERVAQHRREQAPIVADLHQVGVEVEALPDLIKRSVPYPDAIPVILRHLLLPYSDVTRETLARILAVPDARDAWPILVAEYRKAASHENGRRLGAKTGSAAALSAIATGDTMDELIALAKDPSHGDSRLLLLRRLRKSKSITARQALDELTSDPALAKEIASWKRAR